MGRGVWASIAGGPGLDLDETAAVVRIAAVLAGGVLLVVVAFGGSSPAAATASGENTGACVWAQIAGAGAIAGVLGPNDDPIRAVGGYDDPGASVPVSDGPYGVGSCEVVGGPGATNPGVSVFVDYDVDAASESLAREQAKDLDYGEDLNDKQKVKELGPLGRILGNRDAPDDMSIVQFWKGGYFVDLAIENEATPPNAQIIALADLIYKAIGDSCRVSDNAPDIHASQAEAHDAKASGRSYSFAGNDGPNGVKLVYKDDCPATIGIIWTSDLDCGVNASQRVRPIHREFSAKDSGVTLTSDGGQVDFAYTAKNVSFEATVLPLQKSSTVTEAEYSTAGGCHAQISALSLKSFKSAVMNY
jgi:hypothetical protein